MSDSLECGRGLRRFTALVAALQEGIARMFRVTKCLLDQFDQGLFVPSHHLPFLLARGFCYSLSRDGEP